MKTILLTAVVVFLFPPSVAPAQWTKTSGPEGGSISSLVFHGTTLIAGAGTKDAFSSSVYRYGAYRSTDYGQTWNTASDGLAPNAAVNALATLNSSVFAGTSAGIFISTDDGLSWRDSNNGLTNTVVFSLCTVPPGPGGGLVFAGTADGIFLSSDAGASWHRASSGLPANSSVLSMVIAGTSFYAATNADGVFYSADMGGTWTPVPHKIGSGAHSLAMIDRDLFAVQFDGGVLRTTDQGAHWTSASKGLPSQKSTYALAVRDTELFVGVNSSGTYRSTDRGANWVPATSGIGHVSVFSFAIGGAGMFAGSDGNGVFVSTDRGDTWKTSNVGLTAADVFGLNVAANGIDLYASTRYGGVFRSTNAGTTWNTIGLAETWAECVAQVGGVLFVGTNDKGVYRSTDDGATWTTVNNGLPAFGVHALVAAGTDLFAGTSVPLPPTAGGVFRSTDLGETWTQINNGVTGYFIYALAATPYMSKTLLYAGSRDSGVSLSSDGGEHWSGISGNLIMHVRALVAVGSDLVVGTESGSGIFYTGDFGSTWAPLGNGMTDPSTFSLAMSDTALFAATATGGVCARTWESASWWGTNAGFGNPPYAMIRSIAAASGYVLAGMLGGGVWRRPVSEILTSVASMARDGPYAYVLEQNFPNPFNPSTTIKYELPRASHVTLTMYDVLGRGVATLVNGVEEPGYKSVEWNAGRVASGVYLYRLTADNFVQTRKLLVLR